MDPVSAMGIIYHVTAEVPSSEGKPMSHDS